MAQLDFPTNPSLGTVYAGSNGIDYTYTAVNGINVWTAASAAALTVTSPGSIAGTASIGATLTYTTGTATGGVPPYAFTWDWKKVSDNSVLQANGATYVVPASLLGDNVYVQLTATDANSNTATGVTTTFPVPPATIASAAIAGWSPTPTTGLTTIPGGQSGPYTGTGTTITPGGCIEASVNGGSYLSTPQPITSGQSLAVRWKSTPACGDAATGSALTGTVSDGIGQNSYNVTVNRKPTGFGFTAGSTTAGLSSVQTSNTVTITGINTTAYVTVGSLTAGASSLEASINGGGFVAVPAATSTSLPITTGETLQIRFTTGSTASATYTAVVNIGDGDTAQFIASSPGFVVINTSSAALPTSVYNPAAGQPNATPAATNIPGETLNGTVSTAWNGTEPSTTLTPSSGLLIGKNSGGLGTTPVSLTNSGTDTVQVAFDPTYISGLADGATASKTFTSTYLSANYTNTFSYTVDKNPTWTAPQTVTGVTPSTQVGTGVLTPAAYNSPVIVSFANPTTAATTAMTAVTVSINGGTPTAVTLGTTTVTLNPGDNFQVFGTTGATTSAKYGVNITIGSSAAQDWYVTNSAAVASITTPSITSPANGTLNLNPATNTPAGIPLVGNTYSPQNGAGAVQTSSTWEVAKWNGLASSAITAVGTTPNYPANTTPTIQNGGGVFTGSSLTNLFTPGTTYLGLTKSTGYYAVGDPSPGSTSNPAFTLTFSPSITVTSSLKIMVSQTTAGSTTSFWKINGGASLNGPAAGLPAIWLDTGFTGTLTSIQGITSGDSNTVSAPGAVIEGIYVDGAFLAANQTQLTLTDNTNLASMTAGDTIKEYSSAGALLDASGTIGSINSGSSPFTITLGTSTGTWTVGSYALDTTVAAVAPTGTAASPQYTAVTGSPFTVSASPFTTVNVPQASLAVSSTYYARTQYATTNVTAATSAFSAWSSFGTSASFVPSPGAAFGGGYFGGQINDGGTIYNLIVAPVSAGALSGTNTSGIQYKTSNSADAPTATVQNLVYGGPTTDLFKASAAHPVFSTFINGATGPNAGAFNLATGGAGGGTGIGGFNDWYLPAKNELEILYYNLKPTTAANWASSGINPNAVPARASNYTAGNPAQTANALFAGGAQAFTATSSYWSSSEVSSNTTLARVQAFADGTQGTTNKANAGIYARAVRRVSA